MFLPVISARSYSSNVSYQEMGPFIGKRKLCHSLFCSDMPVGSGPTGFLTGPGLANIVCDCKDNPGRGIVQPDVLNILHLNNYILQQRIVRWTTTSSGEFVVRNWHKAKSMPCILCQLLTTLLTRSYIVVEISQILPLDSVFMILYLSWIPIPLFFKLKCTLLQSLEKFTPG